MAYSQLLVDLIVQNVSFSIVTEKIIETLLGWVLYKHVFYKTTLSQFFASVFDKVLSQIAAHLPK